MGASDFRQNLCSWQNKSDANFDYFCGDGAFCGNCDYTAFKTTDELKKAVTDYCNNPNGWKDKAKFSTHG